MKKNELEGMSNYDLRYIIEYTDKKNEAAAQLLTQSPTNNDLRYIIEYTDKKNEAGAQLLKNLGESNPPDEEKLIVKIANSVLSRPGSLKQESWHCGTSHCLGGWATIEDESGMALRIEKAHNTETAGCAVLPNYACYFYRDDNTVLEMLKTKATIKF